MNFTENQNQRWVGSKRYVTLVLIAALVTSEGCALKGDKEMVIVPNETMRKEYTINIETPLGTEEIGIVQCSVGGHQFIVWHGASGNNHFWVARSLWTKGEVILAGLPGHGPVRPYNRSHYRQWTPQHFIDVGVETVKRYYKGRPITLVGDSFGGGVALGVAHEFPELVSRLVLIDPMVWGELAGADGFLCFLYIFPPLGRLATWLIYKPAQDSFDAFQDGFKHFIRKKEAFYSNPNAKAGMLRCYAHFRQMPMDAITGQYQVSRKFDLRPVVKAKPINIPTLIIHGERDPCVPLKQAKWLANALPQAELAVIPRTGHIPFYESEKLFLEVLETWLSIHPID